LLHSLSVLQSCKDSARAVVVRFLSKPNNPPSSRSKLSIFRRRQGFAFSVLEIVKESKAS